MPVTKNAGALEDPNLSPNPNPNPRPTEANQKLQHARAPSMGQGAVVGMRGARHTIKVKTMQPRHF